MSNTDDNPEQPNAKKFAISPDPKIKIKTSGSNPSSVTFTRGDTNWEVSSPGSGSSTYTPGQVIEMTPDTGETTVSVTVTNDSDLSYDNGEMYQSQELVGTTTPSTTFTVDATTDDEEYDFRLAKDSVITDPLCQFYYIRTVEKDSGGNYLYARLLASESYIHVEEYSNSNDDCFQWAFIPNKSGRTVYSMVYARGRGSFVKPDSNNHLEETSVFYHYDWNASGGTIEHTNLGKYWTAQASGSTVRAGEASCVPQTTSNANFQKWQLVPVECGHEWTGKGVLGPSST